MDWSNEKVMEFIDNYEAEPILWNPQEPNHKKKHLIHDAWIRIRNNLSWSVSVEDLKKKRDSLMAYYRTHLNKYKKSVKSGASADNIYRSNWFAFSALNRFLRPIYACEPTIHTKIQEDSETITQNSEETNLEEDNSNTSESSQPNNSSASEKSNTNPKRLIGIKRKIDVSSEIALARKQMNEAFEHVKDNKNDEYEMFGRLIAGRIRKMRNQDTRDILMNDIQNMVFRACMIDRVSQNTVQVPFPSPSPSFRLPQTQVYQSPHLSPSPSSSRSPQCQTYLYQSPSPNPSMAQSPQSQRYLYQSPSPNPSMAQSPQTEPYQSPSPNPSMAQSPQSQRYLYQSPSPNPSMAQSPQTEPYQSPSPNPSMAQSPQSQRYLYQSPSPNPSMAQSPQTEPYQSPSPNLSTAQSPPVPSPTNLIQQGRACQIVISDSGEITLVNSDD